MYTFNTIQSQTPIIRAAGGLVRRTGADNEVELLVVHRPNYDDWSLPKGKLKKSESWKQAAVREIEEETAVTPVIETFAGAITYLIDIRYKIVFYWCMRIVNINTFQANEETDRIRWVNRQNYQETLTYPAERSLIEKIKLF